MANYTLRKRFTFEAAHYLPHHLGKCQRLHGHSWVGWVEIEGEVLSESGPRAGMVMDYGEIAAALEPMVEEHLDHYCLNESLGIESPTSEAIATWAWNHLRDRGLTVAAVLIEETCTSASSYRPGSAQS